jgi:hypothetical protein
VRLSLGQHAQEERVGVALYIWVAGRFAHLGAHFVGGRAGGAAEEVVRLEVAAAARPVAAEGEPAVALLDLQHDHDVVVARAGDLAGEVRGFAGADDLPGGPQGRLDPGLQDRLGADLTLAGTVDGAQGARRAGGDREAVVAARAGDRDPEELALAVAGDLAEDAERSAGDVPAHPAQLAAPCISGEPLVKEAWEFWRSARVRTMVLASTALKLARSQPAGRMHVSSKTKRR